MKDKDCPYYLSRKMHKNESII